MLLPVSLHRFRPRLVEALATYDRRQFTADLGAGLTVGIVALPLAMAFAIASGVKPEQGLIPPGTRAVVLEMHRLISMDTSGLEALPQLHGALKRRGIALVLANVNEQPMGLLRRSGFESALGAENFVPTVADAPVAATAGANAGGSPG